LKGYAEKNTQFQTQLKTDEAQLAKSNLALAASNKSSVAASAALTAAEAPYKQWQERVTVYQKEIAFTKSLTNLQSQLATAQTSYDEKLISQAEAQLRVQTEEKNVETAESQLNEVEGQLVGLDQAVDSAAKQLAETNALGEQITGDKTAAISKVAQLKQVVVSLNSAATSTENAAKQLAGDITLVEAASELRKLTKEKQNHLAETEAQVRRTTEAIEKNTSIAQNQSTELTKLQADRDNMKTQVVTAQDHMNEVKQQLENEKQVAVTVDSKVELAKTNVAKINSEIDTLQGITSAP